MKPDGCLHEILRLLASMPFLDRLEMAAVSEWSTAAVYEAVRSLEEEGLAAPVPHATELTPLTARYHITAEGVRRLASEGALPLNDLLRSEPVSLQWRAIMLKRLDAVAVVYRLASAVSEVARLTRFRWHRATPMDAAMELSDRGTVAVVRWGRTQDRTAFSKRMRRVLEGQFPGGVLMIVSDGVRLRYARRLLSGAPVPIFLALESDAAPAGPDDSIWSLLASGEAVDLRTALRKIRRGSDLPQEPPLTRVSLPWDLPAGDLNLDLPDHALPSILKSAEKRTLDLLSDWPWITLKHLAALLSVSESRASKIVSALEEFSVVARLASGSHTRLALTDRGLGVLAHRDRSALSIVKKRWSSEPIDPDASLGWRNVTGSRSRQLLRNVEHTGGVHAFVANLVEQSRTLEWEIDQLDPPSRASRYFRHEGSLRSIQPDAFGVLRRSRAVWPFFLEWERRAVRPATMASRIAPYLRYYSTRRPADDHGARPSVLVVFHDDLAATRFLGVARDETNRTGVELPLWVSHRGLIESAGPLGPTWLTPDQYEPTHAAPARP